MRLSTFALWSTALVVASSAAIGGEQKLPEFYEAHEIGFIDLNSPQELGGWLSTIPASSPMWSTVSRNDGTNDVASGATVARDPMDGRATAPAVAPGSAFVPARNTPVTPADNPDAPTRTPGMGTRNTGGDAAGSSPPPTRRRPAPTTPVATPPPTTTRVSEREAFDDGATRAPRRNWRSCDPLLHFYADSAVTVNVSAGFGDGLPVAWWPRGLASGEHVEFRGLRVDPSLDPASSATVDTQQWPGLKPLTYLRDALATPVKLGNNVEGGIAYEGVMQYSPDITVRMAVPGIYEVRNATEADLVNAILIPFGEAHHGVALGTVKPGEVQYVEMREAKRQPLDALMAAHLAKTGLFPAEIAGLQKLCLTPEFRLNTGVRLLAQFSDAEWSKRFPLTIAPAPKRLVRVGMLRIFDAQLYNAAGDRHGNGRPAPAATLTGHGRR